MSEKAVNDWTHEDWKRKLQQQSEDSMEYRHKLYEKVDLKNKRNILDVGCGTGAITMDIAQCTGGEVIGIDIDKEKLQEAEKLLEDISNVTLKEADVTDLPFDDGTFDLVIFHLVLIHIKDQQEALKEMARVASKNGIVLATLEPDYDSIVSYPENPVVPLWVKTVKDLGADLQTGRKLKVLFSRAGLKTEVGIDTETEFIFIRDEKKQEDTFLNHFWVKEKILKNNGWTVEQIEEYKENQLEIIKNGQSFFFAPSYYAIGRKIK